MNGVVTIKQLQFEYRLTASYSADISGHSFTVKFVPKDTSRQKITSLNIAVKDCEKVYVTTDNFGNQKLYGKISQPHRTFDVRISGIASTGLDIFEEYTDEPFSAVLLKAQTPLTMPGVKLSQYHRSLHLEQIDGEYEKALYIMRSLPKAFAYCRGATDIHETAENAFAIGAGVCQDYAHIMTSLLRMEGIPARYVVGMIPGEGASHAWVEALCRGYWYGFDPANNQLVDDGYIKVSCGRDSEDCSVIRGSFYGCAEQKQAEWITVNELDEIRSQQKE